MAPEGDFSELVEKMVFNLAFRFLLEVGATVGEESSLDCLPEGRFWLAPEVFVGIFLLFNGDGCVGEELTEGDRCAESVELTALRVERFLLSTTFLCLLIGEATVGEACEADEGEVGARFCG